MRATGLLAALMLVGGGSMTSRSDAGSHTLADTALVGLPPCGSGGACDAGRCEVVGLSDGRYALCVPADVDVCEALRCPPDLPVCMNDLVLPGTTWCTRIDSP